MAASLEKCIVYAVSRTSVDDGHRGTIAWFSMASEASKFCEKLRQEVRPFPGLTPDPTFHEFEAWVEKNQYGSWNYYVPANGVFDELPVDRELHRESGLRKLTPKERKALGV